MQALAAVLAGRGCRLTGSDLLEGIIPQPDGTSTAISRGHRKENVPPDADLVVHTDAVNPDNLELRRAGELGIPIRSYFQMVGELTAAMHCLAVAGTHGKSSTVAMCTSIFEQAGRDPLVFCGASVLGHASGGRYGQGPAALVEACEFRANFLWLAPKHVVLLGIDHDHFDCYPEKDHLLNVFARFVQSIPADGLLIARTDCTDTNRIAASARCRVESFALAGTADWSAGRLTHRAGYHKFEVLYHDRPVCELQLRVPGLHNALNALAAAAMAHANGIPPECIAAAIGRFPGLYRRLEYVGAQGGVIIVDDYAHHPTEVTAALTAVRQMYSKRRLVCVYQPHQALRLTRLLGETADSLQWADAVVVAEAFRAREGPPVPGEADAARLADEVQRRGTPATTPGNNHAIVTRLASQLKPGDVLVTLGAGDIRIVAEAVSLAIREGKAPAEP